MAILLDALNQSTVMVRTAVRRCDILRLEAISSRAYDTQRHHLLCSLDLVLRVTAIKVDPAGLNDDEDGGDDGVMLES